MWDLVLRINVIDGPFLITVYALAAAVFIYLLGRGPGWSWVLTVIVLLIVGAIVGAGVLWTAVNVLDVFGGPVDEAAWLWVPAAFAGFALALWNLWYSRWWRKLIAVLAVPIFALTALLGINASYGLNPTLGSLLGVSTAGTIDLDEPEGTPGTRPRRAPLPDLDAA